MSTRTLRLLALAAVAGGVCWILMAVMSLTTAANDNQKVTLTDAADYVSFGAFAAALALTVAGLLALHAHQRGADGRLGRAGTIVAMAGAGAQCVVISTIVVTGDEPSWFGIAAPVAILTWFAGSIALAVAIRRAGLMPRWFSITLPIVTLLAIAGSEAGTSVLIGAFLIVVGARIAGPAPRTRPLGATARGG